MKTSSSIDNHEKVTLGGGCFWCLDAVYRNVKGVISVISGYAGGTIENPTYEQVCTGVTGHAEVVQITFDTTIVTFNDLLHIFFALHDPTQFNRQGNDVGTQYRSVIFYHLLTQRDIANKMISNLTQESLFDSKIVTKVQELEVFYPAETYHQDYFAKNPTQGYCQAIISPKLSKYRKEFQAYLNN